jgi:hypothetical protein
MECSVRAHSRRQRGLPCFAFVVLPASLVKLTVRWFLVLATMLQALLLSRPGLHQVTKHAVLSLPMVVMVLGLDEQWANLHRVLHRDNLMRDFDAHMFRKVEARAVDCSVFFECGKARN